MSPVKRLKEKKRFYTRESLKAQRQVIIDRINDNAVKINENLDRCTMRVKAIANPVRKG